jgi:hypothetical protein
VQKLFRFVGHLDRQRIKWIGHVSFDLPDDDAREPLVAPSLLYE